MGLVRIALRNPYAVVVMALVLLIIGITSLGKIPVDLLPQFKTPAVQILTLYPGMPTDITERDITNRIERWTSQANGIEHQESRSLIGVSVVKDFFRPDIDPNTALSQVSSLAISDLYYLPPGTIPPMVMPFDPTASQPLALLALSSKTLDETALYDVAYFQVRNLLSGTPGVIAPAVFGGRLRRIYVYVDRNRLMAHNLSLMDVVDAIRNQNLFIPTGDAKIGTFDYQISSNAMEPSVPDFNNIPVKYENGSPVFVKDIGKAEDSYAIQTNVVDINGKRAVYIPIYRQPGANTIEIVEGIKKAIPAIQRFITSGSQITMNVIFDQSVFVRKAIGSLAREGVLGAVLAMLMIFLFLGSMRSTLIIGISLPLSILSSFIFLYFTGETVNVLTLGGLSLAVGILMDNGIVVLENTARHRTMGKTSLEAARDAAFEVATPVLVATLSICVVFAPVIFLTGMAKFLFTPLALAVISAVGASYLMSMTVVSAACSRFLREKSEQNLTLFERSFALFRKNFESMLHQALERRAAFLLLTAAGFILSLLLIPLLGQELFPQIDTGQLTIFLHTPSGTRIENTETTTKKVEEAVRRLIPEKEIGLVVSNAGILYDWPAAYTPNAGPQDSFLLVQLNENRKKTADQYANLLRNQLPSLFPGVEFAFDTGGLIASALNFGLPSPLDIQVTGPDLKTSSQIADLIQKRIAAIPGAVDVRIPEKLDYPEIAMDIDRTRAATMGISAQDIVKNEVSALNSSASFLPSFWVDEKTGNHYFVGVTYDEKNIQSRQTLLDIPVTGKDQPTSVPLENLVTLGWEKAPVEVDHLNIRRVVDVYANVHGTDIGSVAGKVRQFLNRLALPSGYTVNLLGEIASMKKSFQSLGFGFALAVVFVYLMLVVLFRSFVDPFIVIFSVPPGISGAILALWLTRTTLNIESLLGFIMVVGLTVSFSVLMVDFANQELVRGSSVKAAIQAAASIRLRPILMTSLAAILGLVPMSLRHGDLNMPLARAVIGGLFVATLVNLFLLPITYTYFKRSLNGGEKREA